jgi:hypothetical protein
MLGVYVLDRGVLAVEPCRAKRDQRVAATRARISWMPACAASRSV